MNLMAQVTLLLRQDNVNHILIPRMTLFQLFLLQIPILSLCFALCKGVWITVAGVPFACFFSYERIFWTLWKRYYARFTFFVQLIPVIGLSIAGRWLIYRTLALIFGL